MEKSKIIIVEGPQGVGKTSITDYIRHTLSYTNLYRLSGTSDTTVAGKKKSEEMYYGLLDYIKTLENKSINLLFDRTFFSEENYCRLGKKEYTFTDVYNKLVNNLNNMDFDIYYINLYLEDESIFETRLKRDNKAVFEASKFSIENSILQQKTYKEIANELEENYKNIKVFNVECSKSLEEVEKEIRSILNY